MTKNFIFRFHICNLTVKDTAELCFKSVRTVTNWDKGFPIPPECKRLLRMIEGRELHHHPSWEGFEMKVDKLKIPTRRELSSTEILTTVALLEIQSPTEVRTLSKLSRYSRAIVRTK